MSQPLIILASNRHESNTEKAVKDIYGDNPYHLINLLDHHIQPYSYDGAYSTDDGFNDIINVMLQHDDIVFATPVYWYAMSGLLKTFFDRLTDIVTINKEIGRQMKGKSISVIAAGSDPRLPDGFEVPFLLTAQYFGMVFKGATYRLFAEK
ncbi:flavodoxin family protein [Mucilaginibacter sp. AW1-3]